jgi:NADH-quinone oxidoreductase subunit L
VFAVVLGLVGTPFWPWFHAYLTGHLEHLHVAGTMGSAVVVILLVSTFIVTAGIGLGAWTYGRRRGTCAAATDPLAQLQPDLFSLLRRKFFVDEFYEMTLVKANAWLAWGCDWLDRFVWNGLVLAVACVMTGLAWLNHALDEFVVNLGFDRGCDSLRSSGRLLSLWHNGRVQRYLRVLGLALVVFALVFLNRR